MRLVFAGTPAAAVPSLARLIADGHDIAAVITRPDAPLGRKRVLTPSPVARFAEEQGLPVIRARRLDPAVTEQVRALDAALGVIVAYGGLVREDLLAVPAHGWINLHFSLLPARRGAAPVQRSIMAGEPLGASVFQLVEELDAGDVFAERTVPAAEGLTAGDALTVLAEDGAELVGSVVADIAAGTAHSVPQQGEPSLAAKMHLEDGLIDWSRAADAVLRQFRGVTPEPGAHTLIGELRLKIHALGPTAEDLPVIAAGAFEIHGGQLYVGTGTVPLSVTDVQPAGRGRMRAADWRRGISGEVIAR